MPRRWDEVFLDVDGVAREVDGVSRDGIALDVDGVGALEDRLVLDACLFFICLFKLYLLVNDV